MRGRIISPMNGFQLAKQAGFTPNVFYPGYEEKWSGTWNICGHPGTVSLKRLVDGVMCRVCKQAASKETTSWLYLAVSGSQQKVGYTSNIGRRTREHARAGFTVISVSAPMSRGLAQDTELGIRRWLTARNITIADTFEYWDTETFTAVSLHELARLAQVALPIATTQAA